MKKIAIYPGSFDPITFGHIDVIHRAIKIFDKVIVAITNNQQKEHFLDINDRLSISKQALTLKNIEVVIFEGLLIDFAQQQKSNIILRGIRAVSDFEYEFALAGMNKHLANDIETIFITPNEEYANISSTLVREIFTLGGDISKFVPTIVELFLKQNKL